MPGRQESRATDVPDAQPDVQPEIAACRTCPGKVVFIESGNTDGWIATDNAVDLSP